MDKLNDFKKINEIAHKLGITTQQELELFYNTEKAGNETLIESLTRYYNEVLQEVMPHKLTIRIKN